MPLFEMLALGVCVCLRRLFCFVSAFAGAVATVTDQQDSPPSGQHEGEHRGGAGWREAAGVGIQGQQKGSTNVWRQGEKREAQAKLQPARH